MLLITRYSFNTSYVVIKRGYRTAFYGYIFVSIHPMLLLNIVVTLVIMLIQSFNTSYVVIKHGRSQRRIDVMSVSIHPMLLLNFSKAKICLMVFRFNTSYVVIKQLFVFFVASSICGFNTSYVVIKQMKLTVNEFNLSRFQYILCCY